MTNSDRAAVEMRLGEIKDRLNEIWFSGRGPAGGDILEKDQVEFESLLQEEAQLLRVANKATNQTR